MAELLLEIGVEEVPALLVRPTLDQLRERAGKLFEQARLQAKELRSFGTGRRLVLTAELPGRQRESVVEVTGPPVTAAYDAAGKPTPAAIGFAKAQGVAVEALRTVETDRGRYLAARTQQPALTTERLLRSLLPELVGQLEFPKAMHWNESGKRFIRPIRWIVALLERRPVPFTFAGVTSGSRSRGHRELAPRAIAIRRAADYRAQLRRACVLADDAERTDEILRQLRAHAATLRAELVGQEALVTQAVYSCEWPVAVAGAFDQGYLELPEPLLLAVLQFQQGYLPLRGARGGLLPRFLCVIDGAVTQPPPPKAGGRMPANLMAVVRDHERVLRARLEDGRFYLKQDLAVPLADRVNALKQVTFHEKLGTLYDKTTRLVELAREQAASFGVEAKEAERAARLAKADLVTGLVREFPELQGAIGGDYAARQGESRAVADAIGQHYQPRSTGDALPSSPLGQLLSLVDKIDTVVGYFGVGLAPTGSEDPYALRRQAAGVVQLVALHPTLDLFGLLKQANHQFDRAFKGKWPAGVMQAVMKFLGQRLEWQLLSEGCRQEVVAAVLGVPWKNPARVKRWVAALQAVLPTPAGDDLLTVYRRVGRIVPKNFLQEVDPARLTDLEERQFSEAYETVRKAVSTALASEDETATLKALARLRPAVDRFFDKVMVMAEDAAIRNNRLALVNGVKKLFDQIADFSKISTAPASGAREVV